MWENEGVHCSENPQNWWFFYHLSKTTVPNVLKFLVELDFSHAVAHKKFQCHLDKVTITLMRVTSEFAFDVQGSVDEIEIRFQTFSDSSDSSC